MEKKQIKNILYLCEGSGFAGIESYALNLIKKNVFAKDMKCIVAIFYEGLLKQQLQSELVKTIDLYGRNKLKSICRIVEIAKSENIDIIHCVDLKSAVIGGIASLFIKNIKIVATIHGLPEHYKKMAHQIKYIVSLIIYTLLLRFIFDGKILVSSDLKNRYSKIIGSKKTAVIHNGIELNTEGNSRQSTGSAKKIFTIGTVGRLEAVKGHVYMLEAAQKLLAERDDVMFQIIGTGSLEFQLKEITVNLGVADKVHFLGFRPDAKELIASMDIFVLPSLHEGVPFVLLEAMASSKAVICTRVGGVNEIITNGHDGIVVNPKDSQALYSAFKEILTEKNYRRILGENAFAKVMEKFSSDLMSTNTCLYYEEILHLWT